MLILTRRRQQGVVIGSGILVTVLAIENDRVKLGIEAPEEISILRDELHRTVSGENRIAADGVADREAAVVAMRALWQGGPPSQGSISIPPGDDASAG